VSGSRDLPGLEVRRLDPAREADFWRVHAAEHDCGWCACSAWWVPTWDGFSARTAEENRTLRAELFRRGEFDGYVAYAGGEPVGWCQVGPRDRLAKLVAQYALPPDPACFAITCFLVIPPARRRGVARAMLAAVLADLRARGVARVEAYPRAEATTDPLDLWTGPRTIYEEAGFRALDPAAPRLVLTLDLVSR
jgi:GNAT superfamily N-acetyltransferase